MYYTGMEARRNSCWDEEGIVSSEREEGAAAIGSVEMNGDGLEELESEEHEAADSEGAAGEGAAEIGEDEAEEGMDEPASVMRMLEHDSEEGGAGRGKAGVFGDTGTAGKRMTKK